MHNLNGNVAARRRGLPVQMGTYLDGGLQSESCGAPAGNIAPPASVPAGPGGAEQNGHAPDLGPPHKRPGARSGHDAPPADQAACPPGAHPQPPRTGHLQDAIDTGQPTWQQRRERTALDAAKKERICTLLSVGVSRRQAAAYVGCHHATITRSARRDAEFAAGLREAEAYSEVEPLSRIVNAGKRSWRAAAWLLERTQPHKYSRRTGWAIPWLKVRDALDELTVLLCNEWPHDQQVHQRIYQHVYQVACGLRSSHQEHASKQTRESRSKDNKRPSI